MKRTIIRRASAIMLAAGVLSACGTAAAPEPTLDVDQLATYSVQTVEGNAAETAIVQPTETSVPADTATSVPLASDTPETIIVLPTSSTQEEELIGNSYVTTAEPTAAQNEILPVLPTAPTAGIPAIVLPAATSPAAKAGDKASYDSQTPLDNSHVEAESEFDIEWFLLNTGTTTWTTDYTCRYFTGTDFTKPGKTRFPLTHDVPPNSIGSCIVDAVAPKDPGTYKMSVVLGNDNDQNFFIVDLTIVVD
ncbi:MAG: hypothetical protein IKP86_14490 [Anaerolineaceae bacterium]|nr:hypothetical protein [Anaerolineaceae bacterium]